MHNHHIRPLHNPPHHLGRPRHRRPVHNPMIRAPAKVANLLLDHPVILPKSRHGPHPPNPQNCHLLLHHHRTEGGFGCGRVDVDAGVEDGVFV
ncbi:hypothetical protein QC763_0016060 [Podospora pseudopauciseta]|uniref:Uncharacterized protein n=2 Tax=Podospora TaxID=5144 RepID=A0ABR0HZV6_9PEZI|nr:hypothetical protein QC763_0016060 [Podospora pseudopauciseta]KAK4682135.1 hypothetical protein QC764_0016040 [Podospora pseudoanserina]